jgi:xylose isomerase
MRTYLILAEKTRRFHEDPDIQEALRSARVAQLREPTTPAGGLDEILSSDIDEAALASVGYEHERLDQLVTELLLGVR